TIAGPPIQLTSRFEVRFELTNASTTPTITAAGTPRITQARNVKTSLAVKLEFVLGMRIGYQLAIATNSSRVANCNAWFGVRCQQFLIDHPTTTLPATTIKPQ